LLKKIEISIPFEFPKKSWFRSR